MTKKGFAGTFEKSEEGIYTLFITVRTGFAGSDEQRSARLAASNRVHCNHEEFVFCKTTANFFFNKFSFLNG